jgi:hypothetical protein
MSKSTKVEKAQKKAQGKAQKGSKAWNVLSLVAALAAAAIAKKSLDAFWKAATGKQPPANPADPDVEMREALAWAAASGTLVAIARMMASRKAADYYRKSTGHLPAGVAGDA